MEARRAQRTTEFRRLPRGTSPVPEMQARGSLCVRHRQSSVALRVLRASVVNARPAEAMP